MTKYVLDTDLIAQLTFKILPHKPPYRLVMDRTNWQFVATDINVLALAISYQVVTIPLLILMLVKRGNSNTPERIKIMERYIRLFGLDSIDCLLADREFVGEKWITFLNRCKLRYHLNICEKFIILDHHDNSQIKAFDVCRLQILSIQDSTSHLSRQ